MKKLDRPKGSMSSELYTVLESAIVVVNEIIEFCEKNSHNISLDLNSAKNKVVLRHFVQPKENINA